MKEQASDATVEMFHKFMAIAEGARLQDVKDAACNMLASVIVGDPTMQSIADAERHVNFCSRDIKTACRANWDRRKLHHIEQ